MADEQMELGFLPEKLPKPKEKSVRVAELPDGLPGPKPTNAFVESVERFGVLVPIMLIEEGDGSYEVVDGRRRLAAAQKLELQWIPARVYERDEMGGANAVMTLSLNNLRSANPAAEVEAIQALLAQGATMAQIVQATGLSKATVHKRMKLIELPDALFDAMAEGRIAVSVAEKAAKLPDEAKERLVEKLEEDGKVTGSDVREERAAEAVDAVAQVPIEAFKPPETPWQEQVAERLRETVKLVPTATDDAMSLAVTGELMDLINTLEGNDG